ncbi:MAG: 50S ribosomal protein L2 [Candidatus Aenigmarchaeota archaeon]|nr:50S ribosomal protein L2 [Candidatus Aenigmarchaeota archaeon]
MGKRIRSQRKGRGTPTYRVPRRGKWINVEYRNFGGNVIDIVDDPGRNAPVAKVKYSDGKISYLIAPHGIKVGDSTTNYIQTLSSIPLGSQIFGIELFPHSGPKLCNTPGTFAILLTKAKDRCIVQLPSKKTKEFDLNCRASIGTPAGDGLKDKPWLKAGKRFKAMRTRGKKYPRTSGGAMTPLCHPFGGATRPGRPKTVSRHAPPGQKVGAWGARRTGRRKGKI